MSSGLPETHRGGASQEKSGERVILHHDLEKGGLDWLL